jgi:hypothetical protein
MSADSLTHVAGKMVRKFDMEEELLAMGATKVR